MQEKTKNAVKNAIGAVIVFADAVAGVEAPKVLHGLHHHMTGAAVVYGVLAVATAWLVLALVNTRKPGSPVTTPTRPSSFSRFGG